jgi:hypothetical protein
VTIVIDAFSFAFTLIDITEHADPAIIPKMIADMARGNSDLVAKAMLAEQTPAQIVGLGGLGLAFTVFCGEGANLTTEQEPWRGRNPSSRSSRTACSHSSPSRGGCSSSALSGTSRTPTPR